MKTWYSPKIFMNFVNFSCVTFFPKTFLILPKYILLSSFVNNNIYFSSTYAVPTYTVPKNSRGSRETKQCNIANPWRWIFKLIAKTVLRLSHLFQISWAFAHRNKRVSKTTFSFLFKITFKTYPRSVST